MRKRLKKLRKNWYGVKYVLAGYLLLIIYMQHGLIKLNMYLLTWHNVLLNWESRFLDRITID